MSFIDNIRQAINPTAQMAAFRQAFAADWRGLVAELATLAPIIETPQFVFVTRWADVIETLSRPETFTVTYGPHMDPSVGPYMLGRDGAEQNWRDKSVMRSLLRWEDLPSIRALAGETAAAALAKAGDKIDVVATVSRLVPLRVVQRSFGFPGPDDATMLAWSRATQTDMFHNLNDDPALLAADIAAGTAMRAWVRQFLAERQPWAKAEGEDAVSRLLRATAGGFSGFDIEAVVSNVCGLLVGAIETTSQAIANATEQILLRPAQLANAIAAAKAGDNATFDAIVWEALRFNPMTPFVVRVAAQDTVLAPGTMHQMPVKAGRKIAVATGSAMFDPGVFPSPEEFLPRPRNLYLHLGFGSHICLGQYVGYEIIPETIRQILLLPGISLLPDGESRIDNAGGPFAEHFWVRAEQVK
jgi:cytochrome P450